MYLPAHFEEERPEVLHALIRAHPLATIVTHTGEGMVANHIPLQLHGDDAGAVILRGHVARANPMWRSGAGDADTLAVFQGPQAYVSPSWYPTKHEHGRVVPTWNYCAVHAYGVLSVHEDAGWIRALVEDLTATHESALPAPWSVGDAPADHVASLLRQIVGIEILVSRLQGKWKVSQNQPARNRSGAIAGLDARGRPQDVAMAELIRDHPPPDPGAG